MDLTLFACPPSLLSFPNPKVRRSGPPSGTPPTETNGGLILVPSRGRSFTEKTALKWLSKLHRSSISKGTTTQQTRRAPLLIEHLGTGSSSEAFPPLLGSKRSILFNAAQKLSKLGRKSLEKQDSGLQKPVKGPSGHRLENESMKDSTRFKNSPPRAHGSKRKEFNSARASRAGDGDDESLCRQAMDNGASCKIPQPRSGWLLYAAGTATSVAAAAIKGVLSSSAHASVEHGGGTGRHSPPGSGDGGGGGGDSGQFGAGSNNNGEDFFGDLLPDPRRRQDEEKMPRSVNFRKRLPERPSAGASEGSKTSARRVRTLASMSSAAGDFLDGEAPIGVGMMPRDLDDVGPYSPAKMPINGDPFSGGDSSSGQDRPSGSASPGGAENRAEGSRGRDTSRPTFDANLHASSSKPEHPYNKYAQGNEFDKLPRGPDNFYTRSASRDLHDVPPEFSMRGKLTEIPGSVQDGGGKLKDHEQATDFSGWVGGLVHSMVGKKTGGLNSGTGDHPVEDKEKKALVAEVAARTLQMISDRPNETGLAKSSETGALRRLQREAFSDLLRIRERLDKLEHHSGLRRGNYPGEAVGGAKTTLKGEVNSGGAIVFIEDLTSNLSRFSLQHAGMLTGLDVRFTFETPMRENDLLTTQCGVGQVSGESDSSILGGPISLQKVNYVAQINENLSFSVSPLGAKPNDIADTVNHLQGQALTTFSGSGPALYQHCRGSAIGAILRNSSVLLSVSQFLSGWGNRAADATVSPLCLSTLAQCMIQPFEHMVFSLSAVNNLWPSPPLPSSSEFHWSELGPLVLCKNINRPRQPTGTYTFSDLPSSSTASFLSQVHVPERDSWNPDAETRAQSGSAMQSVAISGEVDLGGHVSLGGWAQVERADWLEELEKKDFQWNLSLAQSTGENVNWGLSVGRRKREDWGEDGSASPTSEPLESASSQLQMEAFVKLKVGRGFSLQPGLVYILDKYSQTPAFMVRSSWTL